MVHQIVAIAPLLPALLLMAAFARAESGPAPDRRSSIGALIYKDDFRDSKLANWSAELEKGGTVAARDGALDIDVPAGCTVWFKPGLQRPVLIEYQATVIQNGGANDRVSDLNCFWMATDSRSPRDLFATKRSGKFSDYDQLRCYYVGLGGNSNTTTRFRRYIGQKDNRPLLPQNDLRDKADLITPNVEQTIRLIADGPRIQYWRDDRKLFELNDSQPYTRGHFGLRTVASHLLIRHFQVYRLRQSDATTQPTKKVETP